MVRGKRGVLGGGEGGEHGGWRKMKGCVQWRWEGGVHGELDKGGECGWGREEGRRVHGWEEKRGTWRGGRR